MPSRAPLLAAIIAAITAAVGAPAAAQSVTTGAIQGRIVELRSGEPLSGVTVVVASPSLLEPQTAITDDDGVYKITELTPGDYRATFYDVDTQLDRVGIRVSANATTPVYVALRRGELIWTTGRPPQIDVDSVHHGSKLGRAELEKLPLPGRTIEAAAATQPGAHNDGVGISFAGSTSLENRYLVDGIDITGLTLGDVGTPILSEFVEEVEVIAGGFSAEWGRAIGGIVNAVTRTGSNRFRGSVFGTLSPGFLAAPRRTAPSNASSIDVTADRAYAADFGVELGGPLIRDRLWFYAGLAPRVERTDVTRTTKRQTDCRRLLETGELSGCDARFTDQGGHADGAPDIDPRTGFFITDEIDRDVRSATRRQWTGIAKLDLAATAKHQAQLSLIAVPDRARTPGLAGLPSTGGRSRGLTYDTAVRWTSKLNGDRTEVEALAAWHHSTRDTGALDPALDGEPRQILVGGNLGAWSGLGGESAATAEGCRDGGAGDPYPAIVNCPVQTGYAIGGPGAIAHDREDRRAVRASVLHRARIGGTHELKAGLDLEDDRKVTARLYSGGAFLQNFLTRVLVTRWVELGGAADRGSRFDETCTTPDPDNPIGSRAFACDFLPGLRGAPGTELEGETVHRAAYLRDSWHVRPNVTLNLGLRYEDQQLKYASNLRNRTDPLTGNAVGETALDLTGNWAPRLAAIWDPTEVGRSKLFASWGRSFEAIPMDINDRSFGGEVSFQQTFATQTAPAPCGPTDPRIGAPDGVGCLDPEAGAVAEQLLGSRGVLVAPGIRAQYLDELMLGAEYQLAEDVKLGAIYSHRRLGRVIEDVSTDGAQTYVIANPGEWDDGAERALVARIARTDDAAERARLEGQLAMFRGIRSFDRPRRDYDALELSVRKRVSRGLMVQGSYTFSRTTGNFPGSVSYDNGQLDPNISSQYDLIELLANRSGRLPQDRPHSVKLDAYYTVELDPLDELTLGTRVRAVSGTPKNALGAHALYGADESFLLPRGQLGRTELEHGVDLHVAYGRRLPNRLGLELFVDVFNVYNRQGELEVDATYAPLIRPSGPGGLGGGAANHVDPISGGTYADLVWAKSIDASGVETPLPTARNPNFGRTTARYAPASAQVGFRLTF